MMTGIAGLLLTFVSGAQLVSVPSVASLNASRTAFL
jgi:hypothetical protein